MVNFKNLIRDVPDFPIKGIIFKDITTLIKDGKAFKKVIDKMAAHYRNKKIDRIVCVEARGFIIGSALAYKLGAGIVPVRKKGKLPAKKLTYKYKLEYGFDTIEIHEDAIEKGLNYLILDDLLATGGTSKATYQLLKKKKAKVVGFAFMVELTFLKGRKKLPRGVDVFSLIKY